MKTDRIFQTTKSRTLTTVNSKPEINSKTNFKIKSKNHQRCNSETNKENLKIIYPFTNLQSSEFLKTSSLNKYQNDIKKIKIKSNEKKNQILMNFHSILLETKFKNQNSGNLNSNTLTKSFNSFANKISGGSEIKGKSRNLKTDLGFDLVTLLTEKTGKKGIHQFNETIKLSSTLHYSLKLKEEKLNRDKEILENDIQKLNEENSNMSIRKEIFENRYLYQLDKCILKQKKEKEEKLKELRFLENQKLDLEAETRVLRNKLIKLNERNENLKEYKRFLQCVKERKNFTTVKKQDLKRKINNNMTLIIRKIELNVNSVNKSDPNSFLDLLFKEREEKVFSNSNELLEVFDSLEKKNLDFLNQLDKLTKKNNTVLNLCSEEQKEKETDCIKILKKEKALSKNIDQNKNLICKKLKFDENRRISNIDKLQFKKINIKLLEIHKSMVNLIKCDKPLDKNMKFHQRILEILKFLENILNMCVQKYNLYQEESPTLLQSLEKELEFERKNKANRFQKLQIEKQKQQMIKCITERNNKIYVLPKRKIGFRLKPKNYFKSQEIETEKKVNFNDLVDSLDSFFI